MLLSLTGAVSQGILWGIMVLGVFITFRMLDIADLTVDGSFPLQETVACHDCTVIVSRWPIFAARPLTPVWTRNSPSD